MRTKGTGALLNWLLVATIAIGGTVAVVTVVINTSANKAISVEAERSLLIADMQAAVQAQSESAADFVAHLPDMDADGAHEEGAREDGAQSVHTEEEDLLSDHPELVSSSDSFVHASSRLSTLARSPAETQLVQTAIGAHDRFIGSLSHLNDAAHANTETMSVYHGDTQVAQAELAASIQRLRSAVVAGLGEAVERSEWSHTLLVFALPIAAVGALVASIWLLRARKARLQVEVLEHVISEKDRFIGAVSHELRTPMAAIVGFSELLSDDETDLSDAERSEYLSLVLNQGNEVSAIVDDLLVAARAEIGDLSVVSVPVNLTAQARQVVEALHFPGSEPSIPGSAIHVLGDPGRVRQIIRNLLTNAIRYGGPRITIEVDSNEHTCILRVRDDGDPISPDQQDQMFEAYTTLADGRPVTGSIGLGLTVSRQLAHLMGGQLHYEHANGENIFVLTLPIAVEDGIPANAIRTTTARR